MRILRLLTRLNVGGPSLHAALLTTRLDPKRFSTCLLIGEPEPTEGDLSHRAQAPHVQVVRLRTLRRALHPLADSLTFVRLLRILWQERPHIVHTHMAKAGALGRLAGMAYNWIGPGRHPGQKALLIHTFHGHVLEGYFSRRWSRLFLAIERWLAVHSDCLIAISPTLQQELLNMGIGTQGQWKTIPLGLEISALLGLAIPQGTPPLRVGFVGRFVPIKDPHLFIEAIVGLLREIPSQALQVRMIGDGPLRESLGKRCREKGLSDLVEWTGWLLDPCSCYSKLDVVCLTSRNEGTPVTLIEAMAAGRAVVATDVGGVRDLLGGMERSSAVIPQGGFHIAPFGILTNPGDAEGIAAALKALWADASLRGSLGQAGRDYVSRQFSSDRLLRDISLLYEQLHGNIIRECVSSSPVEPALSDPIWPRPS